ncbi:MAG TPA: UDP-N-acetylmuramate dehydrogenase [Solirubrobacteraceae bacterium]|nr:UDP-N-acetylmuramate dehydrogenase [Solirubrobacteraceae bacterium]
MTHTLRRVREETDVPLARLTTLRVGGPARRVVTAETDEELVEAAAADPALVLAGGSNVVIADAGVDGTVVRVATRGIEAREVGLRVRLDVAAGMSWDELVAWTVEEDLAGFECMSGIPGSVGASPIQNVGAYGQEVSETIVSVRAYDRVAGEVVDLAPADCGFGYRTSRFKHADRGRFAIVRVAYELPHSPRSGRLGYAELTRALDIAPGARAPLADVRAAVLDLRRRKGMVLDPADPDSVSAGSFFTNPILAPDDFAALRERAGAEPPAWPEADGRVKTSAGWLIRRAGFDRGHGDGPIGLSSKHALAIVNRGGGTAQELVAFARELRDGVRERLGIVLELEPVLVGLEL